MINNLSILIYIKIDIMTNEHIILIIDDHYFDVTKYASSHPGGVRILKRYHLKDATDEFNSVKGHGDAYAIDELSKYCIGNINTINIQEYMISNKN